ncbi:hypothetical protein HNY73_006842 [Argiope bruennichi]|uniref:Uncharacterized protein n=1 Tax=Argiope bruennichi TaxID=94029 RepID=A0A8T0FF43_ARGBR|nr:hypothetical protein HNY73_006842 [Argiope bruennichi]
MSDFELFERLRESKSLYDYCIEKTTKLLARGVWRKNSENPFLCFAPNIIEDLIAAASAPHCAAKLSDLKLLLQTGRFQELELSEFVMDENRDLFPFYLSEGVCKNLKVLKILQSLKRVDIEVILKYCINLEEFHSSMLVGFGAFKNCHKLRIWKVHLSNNDPYFLAYDTPDFPESLKNLEIFSVCNEYPCFLLYRKIAEVLENCPKLTSVGMGDSSVALKYLKEPESKVFNFKECHWGYNSEIVSENINSDPLVLLRNAVISFPLVEQLNLVVSDDYNLRCLTNLKHLNCLNIKYTGYKEEFLSHLYSLLSGIGHQLRHLSVKATSYHVRVEDILLYCPNLETLQLDAFLSKPRNLNCGQHRLKTLHLTKCNKKGLMLLLFNCKDLEDIFIHNASCLKDDLLELILDVNPLSNLKMISLEDCTLTEDGLRRLFQSAKSLQLMQFCCGAFSPRFDYNEFVPNLTNEFNLKIMNYSCED